MLALLGGATIVVFSRLRVKVLISNKITMTKQAEFETVNQSEMLRQKRCSIFHMVCNITPSTVK